VRNEYVIGYEPTRSERAGWHRIKVHLNARDQHWHSYAKKGYYADGNQPLVLDSTRTDKLPRHPLD